MGKHSAQNILVFIIFSMFAILSLVLVAVGIKFYKSIAAKTESNSEIRNTVSYIDNKIRSNDYVGGIDVVNVNGKDVLLLSSEENSGMKTAIYEQEGKLKECLVSGDNLDLSFGETIANVDRMEIDYSGNNINVTIDYDDTTMSVSESLHTGA